MSKIVRGPRGTDVCPLCLFEAGLCYIGQGNLLNQVHKCPDGTTEHSVREETPEQMFTDLATYLASNPATCNHDCNGEWARRLSDQWLDWNARLNALPPVPTNGPDPYAKARTRGALVMNTIMATLDKYGEGLV
jgi:hypothetical protein